MDKKKHKAKIILPIVFSFIIIAAAAGAAFFYKDIRFYLNTKKIAAFQEEKTGAPLTDHDPSQGSEDDLKELKNRYMSYRETEPELYYQGMILLFSVADGYLNDNETDICFYTDKEFANIWGEAFYFYNKRFILDKKKQPTEKVTNACTGLFLSYVKGQQEDPEPKAHIDMRPCSPDIRFKAAKFSNKAVVNDLRQDYFKNEEEKSISTIDSSASLHHKAYYTFPCETENGMFTYTYTDYTDDIALHVYYFYDHYYYEIFYLGEQDEKYNEFLELLESIDIQIPDEIRDIKASYYKRSE